MSTGTGSCLSVTEVKCTSDQDWYFSGFLLAVGGATAVTAMIDIVIVLAHFLYQTLLPWCPRGNWHLILFLKDKEKGVKFLCQNIKGAMSAGEHAL